MLTPKSGFDAWWASIPTRADLTPEMTESIRTLCWIAWNNATVAERERCAKVAEGMRSWVQPRAVAAAIREGPGC